MLHILLHSSKTTSSTPGLYAPLGTPLFSSEARELADIWRRAPTDTIIQSMNVSATKAAEVVELYNRWSLDPARQVPAIDAFRGDIYSGLQVADWSQADRTYAHEHLVILSGLYGALRACDGIMPYRLEMGYKLPSGESMYSFWGDKLASIVDPKGGYLINLSAVEYTKALLPYVDRPVITPKFMTMSPKTGRPTFVTVHAKIARGAFARWLIQQRITTPGSLKNFSDLGYSYNASLSTPDQPVFVCQSFQGLGMSVRLR